MFEENFSGCSRLWLVSSQNLLCVLTKDPLVYLDNIYPLLWRRQWQPTPVLLPGKSHGQRSLVGCSPWGQLSNFTFTFHGLGKEMATHFTVLAWRIPGMGEPGGLPSTGSHRVGHDWSDLAAAAAATIVNRGGLFSTGIKLFFFF